MSEYQFVRFLAIDRALSDEQLEFMEQQSSRAEITRWSFTNEYHYGDFHGNAREILRRGYDRASAAPPWVGGLGTLYEPCKGSAQVMRPFQGRDEVLALEPRAVLRLPWASLYDAFSVRQAVENPMPKTCVTTSFRHEALCLADA